MRAKPGAVLVTGGAGFVGSHVARLLAERGRRVVVLDDLSAGRRDFLRWGTFVEGDAGDEGLVSATVRQHGVTAVLHFAGRIRVEESTRDPAGYFRANVEVTGRLARAADQAGVRHFVFSSSAAVYGTPVLVPIPETHPLKPTSPYGENKVEAERILAKTGMQVASLRYFNAAGAEPGAGLGEAHVPETHLLPLAVRAAVRGTSLTVFGNDWATRDGTCVRDYVHVTDLAVAHAAALERMETGGGGGTWNLGTGTGYTVLEVVKAVERATERRVRVVDGPRRPGDAVTLVADATRARADLGWTPTLSSLDRMAADALAFMRTAGLA